MPIRPKETKNVVQIWLHKNNKHSNQKHSNQQAVADNNLCLIHSRGTDSTGNHRRRPDRQAHG